MLYRIIEKEDQTLIQVDLSLHDATALADYLCKCGYEVNAINVMVQSKTILLYLTKPDSDKLADTMQFYCRNMFNE